MQTTFTVPEEEIITFAEVLFENGFTNEIVGTTEADELLVEVHYSKAQHKEVEELMDLVELDRDESIEELDEV